MRVSASTLYNLIACPQRVALDAFGDPNERDEISPFVKLLWERGTLFEKETIAGLAIPFSFIASGGRGERARDPRSHAQGRAADLQWTYRCG